MFPLSSVWMRRLRPQVSPRLHCEGRSLEKYWAGLGLARWGHGRQQDQPRGSAESAATFVLEREG